MLNERLKRVLEQYPEAREYLDLREEWQALYRIIQDAKTTNEALELKERAAWLKMREAYEVLPVTVKAALVC
jgi:hypothetical protein